jgi:hypothetical protein
MSKRRLPHERIGQLTEALDYLKSFIDGKNHGDGGCVCSLLGKNSLHTDPKKITPEDRALYLNTYVIPKLERLLSWGKEEK